MVDVYLTFRPLLRWTDPETTDRKPAPFTATWSDTLKTLEHEIDLLASNGEYHTEVVLEVAAPERAIRRDGGIRADAKVDHPGVVISFKTPQGPLRFATDRFDRGSRWANNRTEYLPAWQMNVRAIALGLEALRKVDRYGITQSHEQYRGFTALGSGIPMPAKMSKHSAFEVVRKLLNGDVSQDELVQTHQWKPELWRGLLREASRAAHPDTGGSKEAFQELQEAKAVLDGN